MDREEGPRLRKEIFFDVRGEGGVSDRGQLKEVRYREKLLELGKKKRTQKRSLSGFKAGGIGGDQEKTIREHRF